MIALPESSRQEQMALSMGWRGSRLWGRRGRQSPRRWGNILHRHRTLRHRCWLGGVVCWNVEGLEVCEIWLATHVRLDEFDGPHFETVLPVRASLEISVVKAEEKIP